MAFEVVRGEEVIPQEATQPTVSQQPEEQGFMQQQEVGDFDRSELLRHGARTTARVAESLVGLPSDIVQGASSLLNLGMYALTGDSSPVLSDLPLPTSEKLRKYITNPIAETLAGKGYLDPQSKGEELADDIAGDLAAFLLPVKGKILFKKALATSGFGNLAKYAAKEVELPELAQEGIKLGTMLAVNFAGPKKFEEIASTLRRDAAEVLPEGAEVSAKGMKKSINELSKLAEKGDIPSDFSKKIAYIDSQIVNNKIPVQDVWDLSQDINNVFYGKTKPSAFKRAFPGIKENIYETMKEYGKDNPQFYKSWSDSNSLFTSLKKSENVLSKVEKNINPRNLGLAAAGSLFGWYSPSTVLKTAGAAKVGDTAYRTFKILSDNPTARRYYRKSIQEAVAGNKRQASHFAKKLDDVLSKELKGFQEQPSSKYEVVSS